MAIFENSNQKRYPVDDTEKLVCTLETTQNIDKHTEYIFKIQRGPLKKNKWIVSHRYRSFASLHNALLQSNIELSLPPKKLIGNMQPSFIAERQLALQVYINEILKHHILSLSLPVRRFLNPSNYPSTLEEQALQTVSIALRGDGNFELKGQLPDIGWRIRKHYFTVVNAETKQKCLLSYQSYGPDKYLCSKDMQGIFKGLLNLSNPFIDKILAIQNLESGAYIVRKIHEKGTLRDMLYCTDYNQRFLTKYGNPKIRKPLNNGQILHYSNQILQALKFLHDNGLFHGHLHPGNIVIENQRVLLIEIENSLIGSCCYYRPYVVELRRLQTMEDIDVYCFGRTLYEITFAESLEGAYFDTLPKFSSSDMGSSIIREWLTLCLHRASCKRGLPSVSHLISVGGAGSVGGSEEMMGTRLKLTESLAEALALATSLTQQRIAADHVQLRNARREERIQDILNSEEEFKKHKRKAKKRESVWKSTSSLAETTRSPSVRTASVPMSPNLPESAATSPSTSVANADSISLCSDDVLH